MDPEFWIFAHATMTAIAWLAVTVSILAWAIMLLLCVSGIASDVEKIRKAVCDD